MTTLDLAAEADRLQYLRNYVDMLDDDQRCELHTLEYTQELRAELVAATERAERVERERDELLSAEHASVLVSERDNYKAALEAIGPVVEQIQQMLAAATQEIEQAEQEASELRAALAAAQERQTQLATLVREAHDTDYPFTESDYAYCLYCDVVGRYRDGVWVIEHTPGCWTERAAAALASREGGQQDGEA